MRSTPAPRPLPASYRTIVIPPHSALSVDGADYTLGILRHQEAEYFRVAQAGFIVHNARLRIVNLQGSGPKDKFHRAGLDRHQFYNNLRRRLAGMKPINALLGVIAILAKEDPRFESLFFDPDTFVEGDLNYATVLQALHFRQNASGIFELDLRLPEREILARTTGANPERHAYFSGLLADFREKLGECFTHEMRQPEQERPEAVHPSNT